MVVAQLHCCRCGNRATVALLRAGLSAVGGLGRIGAADQVSLDGADCADEAVIEGGKQAGPLHDLVAVVVIVDWCLVKTSNVQPGTSFIPAY
jgi:hypothetical protein